MSRTFSLKSGSVERVNLSTRGGARAKARQVRLIAVWLRAARRAIARVLQCVAFGGRLLQGQREHALHVCIADGARGAGPGRVQQPVGAALGEARAPLVDRRAMYAEAGREFELRGRGLVHTGEHDARAPGERLGRGPATGPADQDGAIGVRQAHGGRMRAAMHSFLQIASSSMQALPSLRQSHQTVHESLTRTTSAQPGLRGMPGR